MNVTTSHPARVRLDWSAGAWAGLIAGAVFMMLEMILVAAAMGMSPWAPPRMIAAIVLGPDVLKPPTFDPGILMLAMMVHFGLSIIYAWVLGGITDNIGLTAAILVGLVFGLVLYLVNFYGFTMAFPWFAEARNWISILSHLVFGAVAAWSYKGLAESYTSAPGQ